MVQLFCSFALITTLFEMRLKHVINVYTAHLFFVSCSNLFIIQYTLCILQLFKLFSHHIALSKRGTWDRKNYLASKVLIVYSKTDYDAYFYAILRNFFFLFLPVRSKFFIVVFITGLRDNLPGITNVCGLECQGMEFSVLFRSTPVLCSWHILIFFVVVFS